ncbi:hypothetical protein HYFRA_00012750 [Hymenoscyphus fraxineus]|uniref:Amino acid transporter n=1 Tax=Hymenoscyphus fraxineus TaxID=746836 RepID=A0A9N9PUG4_9HELO|nr:hypothetical protein HYFRA_00012750 [Hymenoscyphus fraxineus]
MATTVTHTIDEAKLHITSVFQQSSGDHAIIDHIADSDEEILVALGYKQEFKRDFSIWSSFSVSFACLGLLPSIASTLVYNLGYIGLSGSVWGWLVAALFIQCVALAMAELCSSMPTAGGLYYASSVLAPEGWWCFFFLEFGRIWGFFGYLSLGMGYHMTNSLIRLGASMFMGESFSYLYMVKELISPKITGWSNFLGLLTGPPSVNYTLSLMVLTGVQISDSSYTIQTWHVYLLFLSILILQGCIAMSNTKFLGRINMFGAIVNLVMVFVFIIWMPVGAINTPKTNSNREVWVDGFTNGTEWPDGFAFLMGFLSVIVSLIVLSLPRWTIAGFDAPFHLSEECSNANVAGPRAIVLTAQMGLYLGWAIILVIAYTAKDIGEIVAGPYGQPMGSLCLQVLGPKAGLAMFSLNMFAQFFTGQGILVSASRVTFAYSRDDALPFSRWLKQVNSRTKTPVNAVWFVLFISALLGLLGFASPVAIGAVFSIGAIAQYIAFIFPIALKLFVVGDRFRPGPWHLGRFSKPVGGIACAFVALMIPILCFPSVKGGDLDRLNMNYACLIYGGSMFLAMVWYAVDARKWFKGPRINVQHLMDNRAVEKRENGGLDGERKLE